MFNALLAAMLLQASGMAHDTCRTVTTPLTGMSGWASPRPLEAGRTETRAAMLTPGVAVAARLSSTQGVRYVVPPEKPGGSVSYGGIFAFTVATP